MRNKKIVPHEQSIYIYIYIYIYRERESKIWKKVQKKNTQTDNGPCVNGPLYTGVKLFSTDYTFDVIWYKISSLPDKIKVNCLNVT